MAMIVFYEKPGCINNTRQKQVLIGSGHDVVALDIRVQTWTPDSLRPFFGDRPVADWFNPAAPRVKSGAVTPAAMDADEALAAMCQDPLLIRRPLIESDGRRMAGFDETVLDSWLGLEPLDAPLPRDCPRDHGACPDPAQ